MLFQIVEYALAPERLYRPGTAVSDPVASWSHGSQLAIWLSTNGRSDRGSSLRNVSNKRR